MNLIKTPESQIQNTICDYLARKKHFFWRNNTTGIYDPTKKSFRRKPKYAMNGVADIIVITEGGYAVFLEVKATRGIQSADQKEFQKRCEEKGCEYYVCRRLEDVTNIGL
jgi:hypothetical protein